MSDEVKSPAEAGLSWSLQEKDAGFILDVMREWLDDQHIWLEDLEDDARMAEERYRKARTEREARGLVRAPLAEKRLKEAWDLAVDGVEASAERFRRAARLLEELEHRKEYWSPSQVREEKEKAEGVRPAGFGSD